MITTRRIHRLITVGACAALAGGTLPAAAAAPTTIYRATFSGAGPYSASGNVTVTKSGTVRTIRLARNFRADRRSIRLRLYVATDRSGKNFVDLGPLAKSGAHSFRVPARVKLAKYRYVFAWCVAVNEPIGRAKLA